MENENILDDDMNIDLNNNEEEDKNKINLINNEEENREKTNLTENEEENREKTKLAENEENKTNLTENEVEDIEETNLTDNEENKTNLTEKEEENIEKTNLTEKEEEDIEKTNLTEKEESKTNLNNNDEDDREKKVEDEKKGIEFNAEHEVDLNQFEKNDFSDENVEEEEKEKEITTENDIGDKDTNNINEEEHFEKIKNVNDEQLENDILNENNEIKVINDTQEFQQKYDKDDKIEESKDEARLENEDDAMKNNDTNELFGETEYVSKDNEILNDIDIQRETTEVSEMTLKAFNLNEVDDTIIDRYKDDDEEKKSQFDLEGGIIQDRISNTNPEFNNSNDVNQFVDEMNSNMFSKSTIDKESVVLKEETIEFDHLPESHQSRKPVSALTPVFTFGYNRHVPIINLSTDKRCFIFYSASHLAIVFDYFHNEQMILQGHCNSITCTSASKDKRWLATGDKGENSVVIIWDCNTGLPVRSMFEPHPSGVVAIALTPDARYLASLSAENIQTFAIWDWTTGEDIPLCSSTLSIDYGIQSYITFNEEDIFHVATNSESRVLFYQWDKIGNIKYFAPKLTDKDFNKQIGKFSNTVFIPRTTKAITATSQGLLVVWEVNTPLLKASNESTPDKKAVKLVPVHLKGINVLTLIDSYIVTGDVSGEIKFFDFNFMLIFWYKDWNFGSITSISASNARKIDNDLPNWKFKMALEKSDYPNDATIPNNKFFLRDFIVGTYTTIFATVSVEGSKIKIIFREHDQSVFSVAAHPTLPLVATGSYSGLLKMWDYEQKRSLKTRFFDKVPIKCLCFDHRGLQLAVGFTNGEVRVLDTHALKDVTKAPFHFSKVHITHILFSEHSEFLATVDANSTTTLYRPGKAPQEESWVYVARYRAHYKAVVDLIFGRYFDTEVPRLFTLGADRRLVEYDLLNASEDNLPIAHELRIEQRAIPLTMCWYPEENKEGFLVTANDEYKLKMYNHKTKMCRFTLLGPTFGSPVKILKTLPAGNDHPYQSDGYHQRYVAYANDNKIGLMRLPFDGNPYNYMTMIAHPRGVTNLCCSFDGNYLISVGEDFIVTVWKITVEILETQARIGGSDMAPYYELIEGGEFGMFMHELKDYFYYSMIRTQGIDTLQTRKVDVVIDISEVPYILRGIGFYPSEEEIENMLNQLKYRNYFHKGECSTNVDMDTFVKLYINHRPAFGIPSSKIDDAFRTILRTHKGELSIDSFLDLIINKGENILEDDLAEYLATLLGFNNLGGSLEMEDFDPNKVMSAVNETLPKVVTSKNFIQDILCMKIADKDTLNTNKTSGNIAASSTQT